MNILFLILPIFSKNYETLVFHGMGDACANSGMANIVKEINDYVPGTKCIESAAGGASIVGESFLK